MKTSISIDPELWSRVQQAAHVWAKSIGIDGRVTSLWVRKILSEQSEKLLKEDSATEREATTTNFVLDRGLK